MAVQLTTKGPYRIDYYEDPTGTQERFTESGVECVRRLRTRWSTRHYFILDMKGYTESAVAENGTLKRYLPDRHPAYEWLYVSGLTLQSALGVPNQSAAGVLTFDQRDDDGSLAAEGAGDGWAVYDVRYARYKMDFKEDAEISSNEVNRYVRKDRKFSIEQLAYPGQGFQFGTLGDRGAPSTLPDGTNAPDITSDIAGTSIPQNVTLPFSTQAWSYVWHEVPGVNNSRIAVALGKVNDATFDGFFPAETLLFSSAETVLTEHPSTFLYYTITYQFVYRPTGWNKIFSRKKGDFYKVVRTGSTSKGIYETTSFDNLFKLN